MALVPSIANVCHVFGGRVSPQCESLLAYMPSACGAYPDALSSSLPRARSAAPARASHLNNGRLLGRLPFPPIVSPSSRKYVALPRRVHQLPLARLHNPLQWFPKPHPFFHACPVCHKHPGFGPVLLLSMLPRHCVIMPCWLLREVPPGGITSALTLPLQPYTYTKKRMTPSPEWSI
jgi:hypothetical protein